MAGRSMPYADELEKLLIEDFYDEEELGDLLDALGSYRPEGGEYLYDEDSIVSVCKQALSTLQEFNRRSNKS